MGMCALCGTPAEKGATLVAAGKAHPDTTLTTTDEDLVLQVDRLTVAAASRCASTIWNDAVHSRQCHSMDRGDLFHRLCPCDMFNAGSASDDGASDLLLSHQETLSQDSSPSITPRPKRVTSARATLRDIRSDRSTSPTLPHQLRDQGTSPLLHSPALDSSPPRVWPPSLGEAARLLEPAAPSPGLSPPSLPALGASRGSSPVPTSTGTNGGPSTPRPVPRRLDLGHPAESQPAATSLPLPHLELHLHLHGLASESSGRAARGGVMSSQGVPLHSTMISVEPLLRTARDQPGAVALPQATRSLPLQPPLAQFTHGSGFGTLLGRWNDTLDGWNDWDELTPPPPPSEEERLGEARGNIVTLLYSRGQRR